MIPVFNGRRFIAEAIESVLAQTQSPTDIIVVDDGSTDATADIAREFSDVTLLGIAHGGVSQARNAGVEAATGDLLAFLDADDTWHPRKLELQAELLAENLDVGIAACRHTYAFNGPIPAWFRGPRDGSAAPGFLLTSALIRRSVWDDVGVFAPAMSHGEDGDWLARAVDLRVKVAAVEEVLMTYRIHQSNSSGMATAVREGIFRTLRESIRRKEHLAQ